MRIDDLNRPQNTPAQGTTGTEAAERALGSGKDPASGSSVSSAEGADQANVSNLAQSLAGPDPGRPDQTRIEQLRLQVQSGTYEVSAQSVANALIEAHLGVDGSR